MEMLWKIWNGNAMEDMEWKIWNMKRYGMETLKKDINEDTNHA